MNIKNSEEQDYNSKYMELATQLSSENIDNDGGPFGAVIVKGDEIISTGVNRVTADNDPTAHAEVNAIREACRKLGTFQLEGCTVYSSCEPCPMCLSALYWAGVKKVFYGNTKEDAEAINFSDKFIYEELDKHPQDRKMKSIHVAGTSAIRAFEKWAAKSDKIEY